MNPELPPPIDRFFRAHNTGHTEDFNALFTADAVVSDERMSIAAQPSRNGSTMRLSNTSHTLLILILMAQTL